MIHFRLSIYAYVSQVISSLQIFLTEILYAYIFLHHEYVYGLAKLVEPDVLLRLFQTMV